MRLSRSLSAGDIGGLETLRDVLRAICIPGRDSEEDQLFRPRLVAFRHQLCRQRVVFDNARLAPDLILMRRR